MRQLRLLRQDADSGSLVLEEGLSGEQFVLEVNEVLRAAVRTETKAAAAADETAPARPVDASPLPISPRDIQMRVRAGAAPRTIADEIGVSVERVLRFAGPVVAERGRIADEARRARARRSENVTVVFGEAVDERYAAHGITPTDVRWDSYRREDGEWVIVATWLGGESEHSAEWIFHRTSRTVTAVDDTAADLLSDRPIRPVAPVEPSRPVLTVAPPLMPGIVSFPPMPEARTGPLPVVDEVFDQEAIEDEPRRISPLRPAAPPPAARRAASSAPESTTEPTPYSPPAAPARHASANDDHDETEEDAPANGTRPAAFGPAHPPMAPVPPYITPVALDDPSPDFDEPPLPLHISADPTLLARLTNLGVSQREESEEERASRARIPSWNDILLGVRPRNE
jgi:hypothetical protein